MSTFIVSKGLLYLYDKQNSTWFFVDVKFLLSCSTRYLTRSLRPLLGYRIKHLKRSSLCTRAHVLFLRNTGTRQVSNVFSLLLHLCSIC